MKDVKLNLSKKSKNLFTNESHRTSFISELTEADIQSALTPIHRIVFAVNNLFYNDL